MIFLHLVKQFLPLYQHMVYKQNLLPELKSPSSFSLIIVNGKMILLGRKIVFLSGCRLQKCNRGAGMVSTRAFSAICNIRGALHGFSTEDRTASS